MTIDKIPSFVIGVDFGLAYGVLWCEDGIRVRVGSGHCGG